MVLTGGKTLRTQIYSKMDLKPQPQQLLGTCSRPYWHRRTRSG